MSQVDQKREVTQPLSWESKNNNFKVWLKSSLKIFTVGEAVRSTCGNSHDEEEKEKEDHFHLHPLKPSYDHVIAMYRFHQGYTGN